MAVIAESSTLDRELTVLSPLDGELVDRIPIAGPAECAMAVDTATQALPSWRSTAAAERGRLLHLAAQAVRDAAGDLAERNHRETGRPRDEAEQGALAGADTLRQYAELGPLHRGRSLLGDWSATDLMVPQPRGVVVVLTPWNDPVAVACGLIGAALATGNTVVHKPSEHAPGVGRLLTELIATRLPAGVLTAVLGDGNTGSSLTAHPGVDLIAHVGSSETGHRIGVRAAQNRTKVLLENGGNDAMVVDGDVDPTWAAEQAALGAFANAGQICTSVERIFVTRDIAPRFLDALTELAGRQVLGPLVDAALRDRVHDQVREACEQGARLLTGGTIPEGPGCHYPATVLADCRPDMRIMVDGDVRAGRAGMRCRGLRARAARGRDRPVRPGRHRAHREHGARAASVARTARRHGEDQRGVRRRAGRGRASPARQRRRVRLRPGTS